MRSKNILIEQIDNFYIVEISYKNSIINILNIKQIDSIEDYNASDAEVYLNLNIPIVRKHTKMPLGMDNLKSLEKYLIKKFSSSNIEKLSNMIFFDSLNQKSKNTRELICDFIDKKSYFKTVEVLKFKRFNIQALTNTQLSLSVLANTFCTKRDSIFTFSTYKSIQIFILNGNNAEYYHTIDIENKDATKQNIRNTLSYIIRNYQDKIKLNLVCLSETNMELFKDTLIELELEVDSLDFFPKHIVMQKDLNLEEKSIALLAVGTYLTTNTNLNINYKYIKKAKDINRIYYGFIFALLLLIGYQSSILFIDLKKINNIEEKNKKLSVVTQNHILEYNNLLNMPQLEYIETLSKSKNHNIDYIHNILSKLYNLEKNIVLREINMNAIKNNLECVFVIKYENIKNLNNLKQAINKNYELSFDIKDNKINYKIDMKKSHLVIYTINSLMDDKR